MFGGLSGSGPGTRQCLISQTFLRWLELPNGRCTKPIFETFRAVALNCPWAPHIQHSVEVQVLCQPWGGVSGVK